MITFDVCKITDQTIIDVFQVCIDNDELQAGVLCGNREQFNAMAEVVRAQENLSPPWVVARVNASLNAVHVYFGNGSVLKLFAGNEMIARQTSRFHYFRMDEEVDENCKFYVSRYLMQNYEFSDSDDWEGSDLIAFAEEVLGCPLHRWQKDMLLCLCKGRTYISGRHGGKQTMTKIYQQWMERPKAGYEVTYTYEDLMEGKPIEYLRTNITSKTGNQIDL